MNKNRWFPTTAISVIIGSSAILLSGCDTKNQAGQSGMPPQKVQTVVAKKGTVDIKTVLPARTNAFRIAEIRPQVSGTILKREFTEGAEVTEGQSLYQIEPGTYQATYNSAKADAEAKRLTYERYKSLLGSKSISRQDYDNASAAYAQAQAALDNAQINLAYTKVYSPINGRIGKSNVTEGALVTNGQALALATVQQIDPIYVDMTQSTNDYLRLRQENLEKKDGIEGITLILENGQPYKYPGVLKFSDITVNETTGSISLRAEFRNPEGILLPGMFVRASVYEGTQKDIFLIPQKAVARDAKGNTSVKVVAAGNVVATKQITVTEAIGSDWVVTSGLEEGDQIITAGLQKIREGSPVEIKNDADNQAQPNSAEQQ